MKKLLSLVGAVVILCSSLLASDDVHSYFYSSYLDAQDVSTKLEANGFEVVTSYKASKKLDLTTVIFTSSKMKKMASKEGRGFAGVLRVLVDKNRDRISIMNPIYFQKAFLQKDYDSKSAKKMLASLKSAFGKLTPSKEKLDEDDIADYHFMMSMPYYEDGIVVGEGDMEELLTKLSKYKKGKNLVFDLKLSDKSYLVGYALSKRTTKFVKKIGTENAQVLPYMILVEDGKATILNAKYYLAISYPLLSMGQFMKISTVPGAIEQELSKPFWR